jgi:hypothetical protein
MRQKTFSTVECPTESAARRALQAFLLKVQYDDGVLVRHQGASAAILEQGVVDRHQASHSGRQPLFSLLITSFLSTQ